MTTVTNNYDLPLSLAVWLLDDDYNHGAVASPFTYSVTEIIKPIRQIVLGRRAKKLPVEQQTPIDIISRFNSRVGQSVHGAIEGAWKSDRLPDLLYMLGISKHVGKTIQINPSADEYNSEAFQLYMEQRRTIAVNSKYSLTGQYDFNFDGQLEDFKFTKTYAMTMGVNDEYYTLQGSLYRHIFPDQILEDTTRISFLFGDWMASRTGQAGYPVVGIESKMYTLLTPFKTKIFIDDKFAQIEKFMDADESLLPECTPDELWKDADQFKYYKNPANQYRATKNFPSLAEANLRLAQDGSKGIVKTIQGRVKACAYCNAFPLCKQKDRLLLSGQLIL
jgi:hypothetical protein